MSVNNYDPLFRLIRALSGPEKRYFKLYASRHMVGESSHYISLFDAVDKRPEYDEEFIKKDLAGKPFLKHFRITKHYLYQLILKSMHAYHAETSPDATVMEMIHQVEILFYKGLLPESRKVVEKAKAIATRSESFILMLELLKWEKSILWSELYSRKAGSEVEAIREEEKEVILKMENENEYAEIAKKMWLAVTETGAIREGKGREKFITILDNPLLKDESKALSLQARANYFFAYALYYEAAQDWDKTYYFRTKNLEIVERILEQTGTGITTYHASVHNLLNCCQILNRYDDVRKYIEKLEKLADKYPAAKTETIRIRVYRSINMHRCIMHIRKGDFAEGMLLIPEIEEWLVKYSGKVSTLVKQTFYYNFAYMSFGAGEYKKALAHLNRILNEPDAEIRLEAYCFAKLLFLLVHFELGNAELLEYAVRSTYRYLYRRKRLYQFENIVLDFIRLRLPKAITSAQLKKAFLQLKKDIELDMRDPAEKVVMEYFDFISWLESKISGRPFAEVVKNKVHEFES